MVRAGNKFHNISERSLLGLCYETDLISDNYDILRTFKSKQSISSSNNIVYSSVATDNNVSASQVYS